MEATLSNRRRFIFGLSGAMALLSIPTVFAKTDKTTSPVPYIGPNRIPNVPLLTHEGKKIHFYDDMVKNKIVVINMMYADCMDQCPLATSNLIQVQRLLAKSTARTHSAAPIQFCSLTLKPEEDTVEHLSHYVKEHRIPPGWVYLTGARDMVDMLRYRLGFYDPDPAIDGLAATHTGMLRIGNEKLARWGMMPSMATPEQIVNAIGHAARWPMA